MKVIRIGATPAENAVRIGVSILAGIGSIYMLRGAADAGVKVFKDDMTAIGEAAHKVGGIFTGKKSKGKGGRKNKNDIDRDAVDREFLDDDPDEEEEE